MDITVKASDGYNFDMEREGMSSKLPTSLSAVLALTF